MLAAMCTSTSNHKIEGMLNDKSILLASGGNAVLLTYFEVGELASVIPLKLGNVVLPSVWSSHFVGAPQSRATAHAEQRGCST